MGPSTRLPRHGILGAALAVSFAATAMPASAQLLLSPEAFTNNLTPGDLEQINAAAMRLSTKPAGSVEQWRNPQSGNAGSINLLRSFKAGGMPCLDLRYTIHFDRSDEQHRYHLNWCKTAAGEWKMIEGETPR
jgi:surface antigen